MAILSKRQPNLNTTVWVLPENGNISAVTDPILMKLEFRHADANLTLLYNTVEENLRGMKDKKSDKVSGILLSTIN